jgi:hypothetical protein
MFNIISFGLVKYDRIKRLSLYIFFNILSLREHLIISMTFDVCYCIQEQIGTKQGCHLAIFETNSQQEMFDLLVF